MCSESEVKNCLEDHEINIAIQYLKKKERLVVCADN